MLLSVCIYTLHSSPCNLPKQKTRNCDTVDLAQKEQATTKRNCILRQLCELCIFVTVYTRHEALAAALSGTSTSGRRRRRTTIEPLPTNGTRCYDFPAGLQTPVKRTILVSSTLGCRCSLEIFYTIRCSRRLFDFRRRQGALVRRIDDDAATATAREEGKGYDGLRTYNFSWKLSANLRRFVSRLARVLRKFLIVVVNAEDGVYLCLAFLLSDARNWKIIKKNSN